MLAAKCPMRALQPRPECGYLAHVPARAAPHHTPRLRHATPMARHAPRHAPPMPRHTSARPRHAEQTGSSMVQSSNTHAHIYTNPSPSVNTTRACRTLVRRVRPASSKAREMHELSLGLHPPSLCLFDGDGLFVAHRMGTVMFDPLTKALDLLIRHAARKENSIVL